MNASRDAGEKMTEDELAEHLSTLLGDGLEAAGPLDEDSTMSLLESQLPEVIDADVFIHKITGFSTRRADASGTVRGETAADRRPTSKVA